MNYDEFVSNMDYLKDRILEVNGKEKTYKALHI